MSAALPQPSSRFGRLFVAFTSRDYRFVWSYFVLNFLAMSMEMLAQGWLVLLVTDPRRRTAHDRVAGTLVVMAPRPAEDAGPRF